MSKTRYALALAVLGCGCSSSAADPTGSTRQAVVVLQGLLTETVVTSGPAQVGQQQTWTATIVNNTASTVSNAFGIQGVQTLNGTMDHARSSAGACLRDGPGAFTCLFGDLAPGATVTMTGVTVATAEGPFTFISTVGGNSNTNDLTEDDTTIDIGPAPTDVQVTGSASNGSPARGAPYSYTFQVKNNGPALADAVSFTDTLPPAILVSAVTPPSGATCSVTAQTVSCSLGDMAVGATANVVIATIAPTTAQTITDTATIATTSPDRNPANDSVGVTVQIK
jgi:uncharacterized repeat protein (TIGR01451 family)